MKISELITKLEELKDSLGDVPVVVAKENNDDEEIPLVEVADAFQLLTRTKNKDRHKARPVAFICG